MRISDWSSDVCSSDLRFGDSVARVRELENIRNFLTGSTVTAAIDLFFTFVFIAVMFLYSPLLTWITLAAVPFYIGISVLVTPVLRQRDRKSTRLNSSH